jgi:transcriptional antiterminator NusG
MNWYALFVATGKEEYVAKWLHILFSELSVITLIPKRMLIERRHGKMEQVVRKMFPGYLLVNMDMNPRIYSMLKKVPALFRILNSGECYTEIPQEEIICIRRLLCDSDVLDCSKIYFVNSRVVVKSGPLEGMEGTIKAVYRRKQRAKIAVNFLGLTKEIDVGIEMIDPKQDHQHA